MLPSPLNFQTPIVPNGGGWGEKRAAEDGEGDGGGGKRPRP